MFKSILTTLLATLVLGAPLASYACDCTKSSCKHHKVHSKAYCKEHCENSKDKDCVADCTGKS